MSKSAEYDMPSWREHASLQAQNDLDELLGPALGFAQEQLAKHGEFFPYAVVVRTDGQTEMDSARPDSNNDRPASDEVIGACRITLAERRDQLRAAAIVADVRLPSGDAVQVELEHTEGPALVVQLPYLKKRFGRAISYGELQVGPGTRHVWL
ncbi:hypothetical protein SAMN05444157_0741 [Frankineae bacterium MT45]|nr:hypothetical protein SAMN05444157_0741 [Frankineae bacterium MT45]